MAGGIAREGIDDGMIVGRARRGVGLRESLRRLSGVDLGGGVGHRRRLRLELGLGEVRGGEAGQSGEAV